MSGRNGLLAAYRAHANGAVRLVTPPGIEPLSLPEAKLHLRVRQHGEDAAFQRLIRMARERVEHDTGRALITQAYDLVLDGPPDGDVILLPWAPLQRVVSVTTTSSDGTATVTDVMDDDGTLLADDYVVETAHAPGRLALADGVSWPTGLRARSSISVRYVVGYGDAPADVPAALVQAMALLVGGFHAHREHVIVSQFAGQFLELPSGYKALIRPYVVGA